MAPKPKKKLQPRGKAAAKVSKPAAEAVQECPAYHLCREKKTDCGICLELSPEAWKEHVKNVLDRAKGPNSQDLPG